MSETVAKRGRGRPRLHPLPDTSVPENPVVKRLGRPKKMGHSFDRILSLAHVGKSNAQIRTIFDITSRTWTRYMNEGDNRARLAMKRLEGVDGVHEAMFNAALRGDVGAMSMYLRWMAEIRKNSKLIIG